MALKQHIVIKDDSILEAVQTASLEWNYFSSRFYDSPSQVLRVRPLGLAWLLLQYDWPNFNTEELLQALSVHEEWKQVPCVLFYLPQSKAKAQKALENFPKIQGIVPVPVATPYLVEVFKHLIEPTKFPMPVPEGLEEPIPPAAVEPSFEPDPELALIPPPPGPPQSRASQGLPLPPAAAPRIAASMTKTGQFAAPRMPAPPPAEIVQALPSIRGSRPNSPFLAFKATSSLPQLSRPQAVPTPVVNRSIPVPRIVSSGSAPLSSANSPVSGSYGDVALPKLPVFGNETPNVPQQTARTSQKIISQLPQFVPGQPRPSIAERARLEAEKALRERQAEPEEDTPVPGFGQEEPRYANLSLAKLRSTGSLPSYVPSPKAVAPKSTGLLRQTQQVPLPSAPPMVRKPSTQGLPPRNPNTQALPTRSSSQALPANRNPSQAIPLARNPSSQNLPGVRKPITGGLPGGPETTNWPPELLNSLETKLTELVGPLAKILLRKAARNHTVWPDLYGALLGQISNAEDQQDFAAFCSSLPINGRKKSEDELLLEEADTIHIPLTSDLVYFFEGALQDYLGALGKVVLRQQVNEFRSTGTMVRNLANQIHSMEERVDFLQRTVTALRTMARR